MALKLSGDQVLALAEKLGLDEARCYDGATFVSAVARRMDEIEGGAEERLYAELSSYMGTAKTERARPTGAESFEDRLYTEFSGYCS